MSIIINVLTGLMKLRDAWPKINTNFANIKAEIDTIVVNASVDPEVALARDSAVKSKVFGSLDARLEESEQDRVTDKADNTTYKTNQLIQTKDVKFIGHRGAMLSCPENTLVSYIMTARSGSWGGECDISPTSDGVWVLQHDDTIDRMTTGTGAVTALTYAQIRAETINSGTSIGCYPNLKVPSLAEYLDVCRKYSLIPVMEVKTSTSAENYDSLLALLKAYGVETKGIIISGSLMALQSIRQRSDIKLQYVVASYDSTILDSIVALKNADIDIEYTHLTAQIVKDCHAVNVGVNIWTVDDFGSTRWAISLGVDYITSNKVRGMRW